MVVNSNQIQAAAAILETGGLVAFPTETVYGLGADAQNPAAVARIYEVKGRPSNHPIIAHIAPSADLDYWARDVGQQGRRLIEAFWPGPLTLVLKSANHISDVVSGGQNTLGLRCPAHPVAIDLLTTFKSGKGALAAPSANRFGHISPTTAQHVRDEFGENSLIDMVLDGGAAPVGIESTIVDISRMETIGPVLLRPGHITSEQIAKVIGMLPLTLDHAAPRASGTLAAHYAPRTPLLLFDSNFLLTALKQLKEQSIKVALVGFSPPIQNLCFRYCRMSRSAHIYASQIYATLRKMDCVGVDLIVLEAPPLNEDWMAVHDRLRRASHDSAVLYKELLEIVIKKKNCNV